MEVSVVVPVRDGERYLAEALESVLGGTLAPAETVVVDDGSTDATAAVADRFGPRARCVRQPPAGAAAATNRGIAEARGELLAFIDADDVWEVRKLELQRAALAVDPSLDAVFGCVREFISPELSSAERGRVRIRTGAHPHRGRGTMLARRELLERVGPFDESLTLGEFVDWHARASELGARSLVLDRMLLNRRIHARNLGRTGAGSRLDYVRVVRNARRRREEAGT